MIYLGVSVLLGDRPLYGIVGVSTRGQPLAGKLIACSHARTLGTRLARLHPPRARHAGCTLTDRGIQIRHCSALYVMPNDKHSGYWRAFRQDFPDSEDSSEIHISSGEGATLKVQMGRRVCRT